MPRFWLAKAACAILAVSAPGDARAEDRIYSPDEVRADLDALYASLRAAQFDPYERLPAQSLERAFRQARTSIARPMTRLQMQVHFQLFVAKIGIAHTRIEFPAAAYRGFEDAGGRTFPFEVRIEKDRVFVLRNRSGLPAIRPADEIVSLNDRPIRHWLARLARHVSGDTRDLRHGLVEYRMAGLLWLELGQVDQFEIVFRRGSKTGRLRVPARTRAEQQRFEHDAPKPFALPTGRSYRLVGETIGYLRPGPFYNDDPRGNAWDSRSFAAFIDEAFTSFADRGVAALIVDLRDNPGGDASFSDQMVTWFACRPYRFVSAFRIKVSAETRASNRARMAAASASGVPDTISPVLERLLQGTAPVVDFPVAAVAPRAGRRFTGKVYVLIDRYTYSNAANVAAIIQDHGFGTIMGEPTTDLVTTQGAMESFSLPISGIRVGYAKARLIRPGGRSLPNVVVPDLRLPSPVWSTHDVVLDEAIRHVGAALSRVHAGARRVGMEGRAGSAYHHPAARDATRGYCPRGSGV